MESGKTTDGNDRAGQRRWLRFSLRTLFVVLTVFGCWLGYQLNWIRQRQEFIEGRNVTYGYEILDLTSGKLSKPPLPWNLRLFGATGYSVVRIWVTAPVVERHTSEVNLGDGEERLRWLTDEQRRELETAGRLFPEADVKMTFWFPAE